MYKPFALILLCLMPFSALATEDRAPTITLERNIACSSWGISPASFARYTTVSGKVEQVNASSAKIRIPDDIGDRFIDGYSTLIFPDILLPPEAIVEFELSVKMRWTETDAPTYKTLHGNGLMLGSDALTLAIGFKHNDAYEVKEVRITQLRCHRAIAACPECEDMSS